MIEQLRECTLTSRHTLHSTTFEVSVDVEGQPKPVARLHKDHVFTSVHALSVLTGPGLDVLEGWVTPRWAATADEQRTRIGTVDHSDSRVVGGEQWTFEQHGLPTLVGRPTGATRARYSGPLNLVPMKRTMDMLFSYRVRFQGPGSEGFEFARLTGTGHPRYSLHLHDDRVSTLLALSAVYYYDRVLDDAPRKSLMNTFGTFLPGK
ncbi:hypothetical protein [Streptacidiphilus carbonis]|uniref:hypothetical protein n=1 Tax=Streptacidiphilus carbonis TaxID=105422 RepID=UPI0005AACE77|nr:hypothetical protein [Streptacidiphilus carbonis]